MEIVWIHCPKCGKASELFLTSRPDLLILNCPFCHCILTKSQGKTIEIDNLKSLNMKNKKMRGLLEGLRRDLPEKRGNVSHYRKDLPVSQSQNNPQSSGHKTGEPIKATPVSKDDIVNLKIALESCQDVSDFLKII
jgi:hypothetical protein